MAPTPMTPTQLAWERLANSMRRYVESQLQFNDLAAVDKEEAVNNIDAAMEAKLEKFHALYDVIRPNKSFKFWGHADTSLILTLRNAIHHHDDHSLFQSWNARIGLSEGFDHLAGAEFLFGSTTPEADVLTGRSYYLLNDFYERLKHDSVTNPAKLRSMWDAELQFAAIAKAGQDGRYPSSQVYVDVMPAFITAVHRVRAWLASTGFTPAGDDGETYFRSFGEPAPAPQLGYRRLRVP